jgi:hypothetical protein
MNQFETLYQQAISDPVFLQNLANDTANTLQSIGITPTDELVSTVQTILTSIQSAYGQLTPPAITSVPGPFVS